MDSGEGDDGVSDWGLLSAPLEHHPVPEVGLEIGLELREGALTHVGDGTTFILWSGRCYGGARIQ